MCKGLGYPFCIPFNLISFFANKKKMKRYGENNNLILLLFIYYYNKFNC